MSSPLEITPARRAIAEQLVRDTGEGLDALNARLRAAGQPPLEIDQASLAAARKAHLMKDSGFVSKFLVGDAEARAKLDWHIADQVAAAEDADEAEIRRLKTSIDTPKPVA